MTGSMQEDKEIKSFCNLFLMDNPLAYIAFLSRPISPIFFLIRSKFLVASSSCIFTGIPLRSGKQLLSESHSRPMVPSSSPRCPTTAVKASGPSTLEAEAEAGQGSTTASQALSSQVQKLVADQASSHQQVQQMYASQAAVQRQMQALMAQLQNPTPTTIPTMKVVPPSTHTSPAPPPA